MRRRIIGRKNLVLAILILTVALSFAVPSRAAEPTPEELQQQIDAKTSEIQALEAEAEKYRQTLAATQTEANTLKNDIARINATIAKLQSDIKITQQRIQRTNLEIQRLGIEITDTTTKIESHVSRLSELVRLLAMSDQEPLLAVFLKNATLSEFFSRVEATVSLQGEVRETLQELRGLKTDLSNQQSTSKAKVGELKRSQAALADKKTIQVGQQSEKNRVLAETQNQEKKYQELLAENEARRKALETEIRSFEGKLKSTVDPRSLPSGVGVLGWPLAVLVQSLFQCQHRVLAFVTQCFGNTAFSSLGAYNGQGHNGVDFRALAGTEVYSAGDGVVRDAGDTDSVCRGASYGKWVLIDHPNGLSTLYAHLSLIKVSRGDTVARGDLVGYSGRTGYATGPHLHFSVLARDDVRVTDGINELKSRSCARAVYRIPVAPTSAYLDPLDYL